MAAGIYVHIPFCKRKCLYCDFASQAADEQSINQYHKALLHEITHTDIITEDIDTLFFGGGTPSIYPIRQMEELMSVLTPLLNREKAEITMEANPGTLAAENLKLYREIGINRLSIGLQSANNRELEILGRIHTYEEFERSYDMAREAGFENINVDIISAIPGQTFESYLDTLTRVVKLNPEHVSAYSLIIEEGTSFYDMYGDGKPYEDMLPNEDADRRMYHYTTDFLKAMGYEHYEISNYAKPGFESRHNLKYWSMEDYYGFGLSAASKIRNKRYTNTRDMSEYCNLPKCKKIAEIRGEEYMQTRQDEMEEFMFLGLRKIGGVSDVIFRKKFGVSYRTVYGNIIERYVRDGWMKDAGEELMLTEKGIDVSNIILSEFILDK